MDDLLQAKRLDVSQLALCALASWASAAACLCLCRLFPTMASPWFALAFSIAGIGALVVGLRLDEGSVFRNFAFVVSSALLAVSVSCLCAYSHLRMAEPPSPSDEVMVFRLEEDLIARNGSYEVLASYLRGDEAICRVNLRFHEDPGLLLQGEQISSKVNLKPVEALDEYYWSKKIAYEAELYSFSCVDSDPLLSRTLKARREAISVFGRYGGQQAGILQALSCGYRGTLESSGEYEQYKIVGLAHMIAVSGSHLAIVASFMQLLLMRMVIAARYRCAATIVVMSVYYVFTGCSISALRSLVMVIASLCSFYSARRRSSLDALAACILGFLVLDPFIALSASFALSAGSTLGIILFSGLLSEGMGMKSRALKIYVRDPVALSLASSMSTLPYSAALFSQLPVIFLLANILTAPLFSISCLVALLSACASLLIPFASSLLIGLAACALQPMQAIVRSLSCLPYAAIPFEAEPASMIAISAALCVVLYLRWPKPRAIRPALLGACCAALVFASMRFATLQWHDELLMLDVGQGDALVLRSEGATLMVDTGTNDTMLRQALARNGVYRLDAVAITHPDDDHCGSLRSLAQTVVIERVILHEGIASCECDSCSALLRLVGDLRGSPELTFVRQGDSIRVGSYTCRVVWPQEFKAAGGNADSLSLLVRHTEMAWSGLFAGDAESQELLAMSEMENLASIDYLKLGHHGSAGSMDEELLELLSPQIVLISVGENNRYGHPDDDVLNLLLGSQVKVMRTDLHGDVRLRFTDDEIKVKAQRSLG